MEKLQAELQNIFGDQRIRINESLDQYVPNHQIHVPLFLVVNSKDELVQVITLARKHNIPFLLIDQDLEKLTELTEYSGLVIKDNARKFDILARKGKIQSQQLITAYALIEAESGASFNGLVRFTIDQGLGGLESVIGISGSVSKVISSDESVVEYFSEQDIVQSVTILTPENEVKEVSFQDLKPGLLVLSIIFKLQGEDTKILWLKAQKSAEKRGIQDFTAIH